MGRVKWPEHEGRNGYKINNKGAYKLRMTKDEKMMAKIDCQSCITRWYGHA